MINKDDKQFLDEYFDRYRSAIANSAVYTELMAFRDM